MERKEAEGTAGVSKEAGMLRRAMKEQEAQLGRAMRLQAPLLHTTRTLCA